MLKGIDISNWQSGLKLRPLALDFVIAKASEGVSFRDPTFSEFMQQADNAKMLTGAYHFATGNPVNEATYFYTIVKNRVEKSIFALDLEYTRIVNWGAYADAFVKEFKRLSGVYPLIYTSAGFLNRYADRECVETCELWLAGYPKRAAWWNDGIIPYKTYPWAKAAIWQFTGTGQLANYNGNLDLDWCYLTREEWSALAKGSKAPATTKSVDVLAKEVIAGKWGAGDERKKRLTAAGYNYAAVQKRVNQMLSKANAKTLYDIAREVIAGKWGAGADRKHRLQLAGYNYDAVQKIVNEIMKSY